MGQNMKTGGLDRENSNEYQDDGIGDLIFNGEFSDTDEYLSLPTGKTDGTNSQGSNGSTNTIPQSRSRSTSAVDMMRFRANSLAFGGLLEEPSSENIYGKWMDRSPILESNDKSKNHRGMNGKKKTTTSQPIHHTVEQNGKPYYATSNKNIDDGHNRTANANTNTKSQQALLRKLEREGKKAEKERKKQERKEKKEKEMKLKKAKEAKEKQQKKEMKAALAKLKAEDKRKKKQDTNA